jgi:predicted ATPase
MKIDSLHIANFRGIGEVRLADLGTMVVIAGQNGSGKSCIFDAIRLLKSVFGGYQANEWQQWMGEFQINLSSRSSDFLPIFNDPTKELRISCEFRLAESERQYIMTHAHELLREKVWRTLMPEAYAWGGLRLAVFAAQFREREPEVAQRVAIELPALIQELSQPTIRGTFYIPPGDIPKIQNSLALSVIFGTFRPQEIGVIDYHGAQRHYGRENVQGINLNLDANEQQRSQSALYNYGQKYTNVKGEMAASYVKEILAEQAGVPRAQQASLTNTLKELFETFFPDKKFLGPQPTAGGLLTFPVVTPKGRNHDLDDLSSGEKEILYGYLRIRSSAPRFSIILLDEPELHLNPRLIRDLPQFYRKNLGEALQNQLWLVTHSDALLREVVARDKYNVFHMLPQSQVAAGESQLKPLSATADLDLALTDLIGDLAAYRPGGKVLILEGGGDSDFDQKVVATLFPEITEHANLISGTNKTRVESLLRVLEAANSKGQVPYRFFSVTDRDSEVHARSRSANSFSWNVYHIENYFLVPKYIAKVLSAVQTSAPLDEEVIWDELRTLAKETLPQLVRHELSEFANAQLVQAIDVKTDPRLEDQAPALVDSIDRSLKRLIALQTSTLTKEAIGGKEKEIRERYVESIADGSWVNVFRGRDVLKRFVGKNANSVSYEVFRNLVLAQMKDDAYRPVGMKDILDKIIAAQ